MAVKQRLLTLGTTLKGLLKKPSILIGQYYYMKNNINTWESYLILN